MPQQCHHYNTVTFEWRYSYLLHLKPLNAELNPICHLLALLGAHYILHVSRIRVNSTQICGEEDISVDLRIGWKAVWC